MERVIRPPPKKKAKISPPEKALKTETILCLSRVRVSCTHSGETDLMALSPKGNLHMLRLKKRKDLGGHYFTSSQIWFPGNIHFFKT